MLIALDRKKVMPVSMDISMLSIKSKVSILGLLLYPTPGADLEVELVQLNHCDGVYSNY